MRMTNPSRILIAALAGLALASGSACSGSTDEGAPASVAESTAPDAAPSVAIDATAAPVKVDTDAARASLGPEETLDVPDVADDAPTYVQGRVQGNRATVYAIAVGAGQTLEAAFDPPSNKLYFNVMDAQDHSGAAVHRGEVDTGIAHIVAPADMTYLVQPFQPRAQALHNEASDYRLRILRSGGGGASTATASAH